MGQENLNMWEWTISTPLRTCTWCCPITLTIMYSEAEDPGPVRDPVSKLGQKIKKEDSWHRPMLFISLYKGRNTYKHRRTPLTQKHHTPHQVHTHTTIICDLNMFNYSLHFRNYVFFCCIFLISTVLLLYFEAFYQFSLIHEFLSYENFICVCTISENRERKEICLQLYVVW